MTLLKIASAGLKGTIRATTPWPGSILPNGVLRMAGLAAGALGAGVVALSAAVGYRSARPGRRFGRGEPPEGSYEQVSFLSADGLRLSGWFLPAGSPGPGLVLCHGFQTGRREGLSLALALRDLGYNVLTFDFRAHGESGGRWTSCGLLEVQDLTGAVRYLKERPELAGAGVGVLGFSMGAAVAIMTAASMPEIAAVVADSSFASLRSVLASGYRVLWRLPAFPMANLSLWFAERLVGVCADDIRPLDLVAAISPRPILIVHGEKDRLVPPRDAHLLYEAAREPKELWLFPGADHVQAREIDLAAYSERVDAFFRRWLGSAPALVSRAPDSSRS